MSRRRYFEEQRSGNGAIYHCVKTEIEPGDKIRLFNLMNKVKSDTISQDKINSVLNQLREGTAFNIHTQSPVSFSFSSTSTGYEPMSIRITFDPYPTNVGGMLKNHCLAKGIASASWSEFFRMLQYKSDWRGVNLIRIGRFEPSSKMCGCGYIHRDLKLSDRVWTCPECGSVNDRDLLAANNIKRFGLEKKNLLTQENINKTPVVNREGGVELSAVVGAVKRQNVLV